MKRVVSILSLLVLLVGCEQGQKRTYDVTVKNQSAMPVTIWLTKNGPPWEDGWKSPEDLAIESPKVDEKIGGVIVPPGRTAVTGKRTGTFAPKVDAILRVYHGQKLFDDLLAIHADSPNRTDVVLDPGVNEIIIADTARAGGITVTRQPQPAKP
jgi:hypothetical protein